MSRSSGPPPFGPRGDEFLFRGLPLDWQSGVSVTPETAAMLIAKQTGRLVDRVPRLVGPRAPHNLPFSAKWAVHLDRPVTVRATDAAVTWATDELYIGNESVIYDTGITRALMAAAPAQPATVPIQIPTGPLDSIPIPTTEYLLTAQPGMALVLSRSSCLNQAGRRGLRRAWLLTSLVRARPVGMAPRAPSQGVVRCSPKHDESITTPASGARGAAHRKRPRRPSPLTPHAVPPRPCSPPNPRAIFKSCCG